jgi:hypothetical protein
MSEHGEPGPRDGRARKAGAFDIRSLIALLIGIFGVILILAGIFDFSESDKVRTDDVNLNLWTGLAMVAAAAILQCWAMLRPVVVPDDFEESDDADLKDPHAAG